MSAAGRQKRPAGKDEGGQVGRRMGEAWGPYAQSSSSRNVQCALCCPQQQNTYLCGWARWRQWAPAPSACPPGPCCLPAAPTPAGCRARAAGWSGAAAPPPRCASLQASVYGRVSKGQQRSSEAAPAEPCSSSPPSPAIPSCCHSLLTSHGLGLLSSRQNVAIHTEAEPEVTNFKLAAGGAQG